MISLNLEENDLVFVKVEIPVQEVEGFKEIVSEINDDEGGYGFIWVVGGVVCEKFWETPVKAVIKKALKIRQDFGTE